MAALYRAQGRYAEAEPLYRRSLAIEEKALGPDHPDLAISLHNIAGLYRAQGRYAEAEPPLEPAEAWVAYDAREATTAQTQFLGSASFLLNAFEIVRHL